MLDTPVVSGIAGAALPPVVKGIVGATLLPVPSGTEELPVASMVGKVSRGAEEAWAGELPRLDETEGRVEVWLAYALDVLIL